jgi:hypothetical protein
MRSLRILLIAVLGLALCADASFAGGGKGRSSGASRSRSSGPGTGSKSSSSRSSGYTRSNGTHVNSYRRTTPDSSSRNNYSTKGNSNPHTGKSGTRVTPRNN